MKSFCKYYFTEKTIATRSFSKDNADDTKCMEIGQKLADRFGLTFNGWWEFTYTFTIPAGVPDETNTLTANNESEVIEKLEERFPKYLEYIMQKNFPDGYKPDPTIPSEVQPECEPIDLNNIGKE